MSIDLRLLPLAAACWLGCVLGLHTASGWLVVSGVVITIIIAVARPSARVLCATVLVGTSIAGLRVAAADPAQLTQFLRNTGAVGFTAVINSEPQRLEQRGFGGLSTEESWQARATLLEIRTGRQALRTSVPVTIRWRTANAELEVGAHVRGHAIAHSDDVKRRSTYRLAVRGELQLAQTATRGSRITNRIRHSLADVAHAQSEHPRDGATLLPGLVLGDTSAQSRELADNLRTSGLSHLTAVSGANVAIVLGAVLWLLQRTRIRRSARFALLGGLLVLFVAVVQPQPSVMRAAVMGAIALYALATGATKASAAALWMSVVLLLLLDPFMAWQYGFGLSVAATAGLIVLQPLMMERLPKHRWLNILLITVAAQLATLPLLLVMGSPPTWLSIPANALAEPLVAPATVSGFLATTLASCALLPIPLVAPMLHVLAEVSAWPGVLLCDVIVRIAAVGANSFLAVSPFASVGSSLLFVATVAAAWKLRRHRRLAAMLLGAYFAVSFCGAPHHWPPKDWWYAMCDVGQGDAGVVRTGPSSAVVIDAGPDARAMRTCLRRLGVHSVDAMVLTHFHADHVEGVSGVLAQAGVRTVFASPLHDPLIEYQRVVSVLRQPVRTLVAGDRFEVGSASFEVLWPEPEQLTGDPNNASLVMLVRTPSGSLLLTGDADPDAQVHLPVTHVDVLKVPHHGSRFQDFEYLRGLRPSLALVSVGTGNDYGHPAVDTVTALRGSGARVLRTDEIGGIAVATRGNRLTVAAERG